jgi:hypothetical protein
MPLGRSAMSRLCWLLIKKYDPVRWGEFSFAVDYEPVED